MLHSKTDFYTDGAEGLSPVTTLQPYTSHPKAYRDDREWAVSPCTAPESFRDRVQANRLPLRNPVESPIVVKVRFLLLAKTVGAVAFALIHPIAIFARGG